jgi:TRAP-type uncharacterized transport system fused permease subunit
VSYLKVAAFALLPALLYYVAVFMAVHFEAKRTGLVGLPKPDLPRLGQVLRERGHLFLPLVIIVAVLLSGKSAAFSALCGTLSVVPTTWLRASTRYTFTPRAIMEALEAGARNTIVVALACACAGIVIGTITLTGLGLSFTGIVLALSQNSLILALVLTMVAGILLGMGLPTTPGYIIPFMFVFGPSLLMIGDWTQVVLTVITATVGVTCLAGGLHSHFFFGTARYWERALLIGAAFVLIKPGLVTDAIGALLVALTIASQLMVKPAGKAAAATPATPAGGGSAGAG